MKNLSAISKLLPALFILVIPGVACDRSEPTTSPALTQGGPVRDRGTLIDNLRAAGATVEPTDEQGPFEVFSAESSITTVNGERVRVLEYPDEATAEEEAGWISPNGATVTVPMRPSEPLDYAGTFAGTPHYYKSGKLIVYYVGTNEDTMMLLEGVLGAQFAGGCNATSRFTRCQ